MASPLVHLPSSLAAARHAHGGGRHHHCRPLQPQQPQPRRGERARALKVAARATAGDEGASAAEARRVPGHLLGLAASLVVGLQGAAVPAAHAFGGEIELTDVNFEVVECKPNTYLPSKGRFVCAEFTAMANNKLRINVKSANVFGFINDVDNNSAAAVNLTGASRTVLAPIYDPVPAGKSQVKFDVVLDKASLDKGPLKLKGFKAVASTPEVEKRFAAFDDCELDPAACELEL